MKYTLMVLALVGANASAKATYNPEKQKALIVSMQGETIVAHVCEKVSEDDVRKPTDETLSTKCTRLSGDLDQPTFERNLDKVKKMALADIAKQKQILMDQMGAVLKDDEGKKAISEVADSMLALVTNQIEAMDAATYVEILKTEARTPTVEIENKAEDLDQQIEALVLLTNP